MQLLRRYWLVVLCLIVALGLFGCSGSTPPPEFGSEQQSAGDAEMDTAAISGFSKIYSFLYSGMVFDLTRTLAGSLSTGLGAVMSTVASGDSSDATIQRLTVMEGALTRINTQTGLLGGRLDVALGAIGKSRSDITGLNAAQNLTSPLQRIQSNFAALTSLADPSPQHLPAEAVALMHEVLDTNKSDLMGALSSINAGVMGSGGTGGALRLWAQQASQRVQAGQDPVTAYLTLEHYFAELLNYQAQGLVLVADAKTLEASLPPGARMQPASAGGTAAQYRDSTFLPRIERQMHLFLELSEQFALSNLTPRSGLFLSNAPKAAEIFRRSDWVAAQLCEQMTPTFGPKFQYGLHVHVLLESGRVAANAVPSSLTLQGKTLTRAAVNGKAVRTVTTPSYLLISTGSSDPATGYNNRQMSQNLTTAHYQARLTATDSTGTYRDSFAWAQCPPKNYALNVRRYKPDFQYTSTVAASYLMGAAVIDYRVLSLPMVWHLGEVTNAAEVVRARQAGTSNAAPSLTSWIRLYGTWPAGNSDRWARTYLWTEWRWIGAANQSLRARVQGRLQATGAYSLAQSGLATEAQTGAGWSPRGNVNWLTQNGEGTATGGAVVSFSASTAAPVSRLMVWIEQRYNTPDATARDFDARAIVTSVLQEPL